MISKEDVEALRRIRNKVPMQRVIDVLNDKDVNYYNWSDLDMLLYYFDNNLEDYEITE